jgi:hypothetical protein
VLAVVSDDVSAIALATAEAQALKNSLSIPTDSDSVSGVDLAVVFLALLLGVVLIKRFHSSCV